MVKYLSILYCISSGLNDENLGSDEAEIVNFSNIIINITNLRVIECCEYFIHLNKSYEHFQTYNSVSLVEFLYKFDNRLKELKIHPTQNENEFSFVTNGPLHLRQALIPECSKKNINMPFYYFKYFDLLKEFRNFSNCQNFYNLNEIKIYLAIDEENLPSYSMKQSKLMQKIIFFMLEKGHSFGEPELISNGLEKGLVCVDENIEDNTIVKARGLPWQCTDHDVSKFFIGLNITKGGVALCLSQQGRRNGEALVRFENEEQRNLALKRHKHHMGTRYIEVYRANGKDFLSVAGGSSNEAKAFLTRNGKIIVRMRGLPFDSTPKDVAEFFQRGDHSCKIVDDESGVLFVHYPDGRATGDAFVMFETDEEASKALLKHKENMGQRYIELFRSSAAEVQQVFKRSQDPKNFQTNLKDVQLPPLSLLPPEMMSGTNKKDCIRIKNLPVECGIEHILEFLGIHSQHIVQQGVHMILNSQGLPSGEAFIQFDGEHSAQNAALHKNNKFMIFYGQKFPVEVNQCSGEEMNLVLLGLIPSNLINHSANTNTILPSSSPSPFINPIQQIPTQSLFYPNLNSTIKTPTSPLPILQSAQFNNPTGSFAPILWYYPTPPVSPSPNLFLHPTQMMHSFSNPMFLILKNAPLNTSVNDVLQFFSGYEIMPEFIQLLNNTEIGANSSNVLITLFNRNEAERALIEKNHQKMGNNVIELYLSV